MSMPTKPASPAAGHGHGHASGEGASPESVAARFELSDARARPLVIGTIGIFVLIIASFGLIAGLLFITQGAADSGNSPPSTAEVQAQLPPEPRLEQNPQVDGDRLINEARTRLEGYGWVNERAGTAHIPIERAKELLLEKGVNGVGAPEAQSSAP